MVSSHLSLLALISVAIGAAAETHTIMFTNDCGTGTPTLVENGYVVSTGAPITNNGPFSFVAFLQTGSCGSEGEGCTTVEGTLQNSSPSFANVTLTPPHAFSGPAGYGFYGGDGSCDGLGFDCTQPSCPSPFGVLGGTQTECSAANINLVITFCD